MNVSAAILAGGRARRFGGIDKCRLVVDGRAIIVRQIEVLQRVAGRTVIVAGDADRFADLGLDVVPDVIPGIGALGGIYTALATAPAELVVVVACDLPFLDANVLTRLIDLAGKGDGAWIRSSRGIEPLIACYRAAAAAAVRAAIDAGRLKAADLAQTLQMVALDESELAGLGADARLLTNLNSPDDLARVQ